MKKQLFLSVTLLISLILTACNNNNDTNETSQTQPSDDNPQGDPSGYDRSLVEFPEDYQEGISYATVTRGNVYEEVYTSRETIEAVQNGEPIPDGAVITLEIHRDGELDEIFVMEKRTDPDWGTQNPEGTPQNGDWLFQEFKADRSLDEEDDINRCFSCHANQEQNDFVVTYDRMNEIDLDEIASTINSDTDLQNASVAIENWEVKELINYQDDMDAEESSFLHADLSDRTSSGIPENYSWSEVHQDIEKDGLIGKTLSAIYLQQFLDTITDEPLPVG